MVVHLGSEGEVMDDGALKELQIWLKEAKLWEVSAVCGSFLGHSQSSSNLQIELMDGQGCTSRRQSLGFLGSVPH